MARDLEPEVVAAALSEVVRPVVLVALEFDSGTVRLATSPFDLRVDADEDSVVETFTGAGSLGAIGPVQESTELRATNIDLSLSGIPSEVLSLALTEEYQGRPASIWIVLLDEDHSIVGAPCSIFRGHMDVMSIDRGAETSTVHVTAESRLVDLERSRIIRYTDADQQQIYPGDKGFAYCAQMITKEIIWGTFAGKSGGIRPLVG